MKKKKEFEIKIETPTLSRRAIVVEDDNFKRELKASIDSIRSVIERYESKKDKHQTLNEEKIQCLQIRDSLDEEVYETLSKYSKDSLGNLEPNEDVPSKDLK